jgi:hypothetical protein
MKVKELVEQLSKYDQEAELFGTHDDMNGYFKTDTSTRQCEMLWIPEFHQYQPITEVHRDLDYYKADMLIEDPDGLNWAEEIERLEKALETNKLVNGVIIL